MLLYDHINNLEEKYFHELFTTKNRELHYFLIKLEVYDINLREEFIQIAFINIFKWIRKGNKFESNDHLLKVLFTSTKRAFHNSESKKKYRPNIVTDNIDENTEFLDHVEIELVNQIYQAIESLPTEAKKIFKLFFLDGASTKEISLLMNISPQTVLNQKTRAIKLIRERLKTT